MKASKIIPFGYLLLFICLLPLSSFGQATGKDQVRLKSGEIKQGNITKEDFRGLSISVGSAAQDFQWEDIAENGIIYNYGTGKLATDWPKAKRLEDEGKYKDAAVAFKVLSDEIEQNQTKYRDIFKQHVLYSAAFNYQRSSQLGQAINYYTKLLSDIPETKYIREANLNKIKCTVAQGDTKGVIVAIEGAKNQITKVGMGGDLIYQIDLIKARILTSTDIKTATQIYKQVKSDAASKHPAFAEIATVGLGLILLKENPTEAERHFNEVIDKSTNSSALAGAYKGLGDVYFQKAEQTHKIENYHDALINYLKTNVLFLPEEEIGLPYYIEATFQAGICFTKMLNFVDPKKQEEYKKFANDLFTEIIDKFKDSSLAPLAEEEKKKLEKN